MADKGDKPPRSTGIKITGGSGNTFKNFQTRNVDSHIEIQGIEDSSFENFDSANSPEWETARRRRKEKTVKGIIITIFTGVAVSGVAHFLGWA